MLKAAVEKWTMHVMANFSVEMQSIPKGIIEMKNIISDVERLFEGLIRKLDCAEKIKQSKISNDMGKIWLKIGTNFQETSPDRVTWETVILAISIIWQRTWPEPRCPGFLSGG